MFGRLQMTFPYFQVKKCQVSRSPDFWDHLTIFQNTIFGSNWNLE